MIDYHGSTVALDAFVNILSATAFPEPEITDAQLQALDAASSQSGSALLGALMYHLLAHAASDGTEIALLERAADLWERGVALCGRLDTIRAQLEEALEHPSDPGAAQRFNQATVDAQEFGNTLIAMNAEIDSLRSDLLTFAHQPPHPRQSDLGTEEWDWGNLVLGRRTDALARSLFRNASDPATMAFATGAAASYGGNVAGSAYLGMVVGGPRRTQRFRDRIARNAVGSWFANNHPAAMSLSTLADRITFGGLGSRALPAELEQLIQNALAETFDLGRTQPLPNLQLGYRRMLRHLTLLDRFAIPPTPTPPAQVWMAALYGDPQNPPPSLRPQDADLVGQDGGGVAGQYSGSPSPGSQSSGDSDSAKVSKGCGILVLVIIAVDLVQAFVQCIGQWANGNTCTFWDNMLLSDLFEQDPPDPRDPTNPNTSSDELSVIAGHPQATQLVGLLFDAHLHAWEAIDRAYAFLAVTGLIYPGRMVTSPLYNQFTSIPAVEDLPFREEPDPVSTYHLYPSFALENPIVELAHFPVGATPDEFLDPLSRLSAPEIALQLWRQVAAGEQDSDNRDLDADRGARHSCWAANGSVHDDPIDVLALSYDEQ